MIGRRAKRTRIKKKKIKNAILKISIWMGRNKNVLLDINITVVAFRLKLWQRLWFFFFFLEKVGSEKYYRYVLLKWGSRKLDYASTGGLVFLKRANSCLNWRSPSYMCTYPIFYSSLLHQYSNQFFFFFFFCSFGCSSFTNMSGILMR